jgi:hypothetical protein
MADEPTKRAVYDGPPIEELETRQDEILRRLDELNDRILGVLKENGVLPPNLPAKLPAIGAKKAA